ncbi:MAG: radical SAM protein [Oscillospiraceae bacterium]|jgi:uncharacterized radical SAM superfamily Fe-S cluster-containing enzyme|nr:radical SAM protein [Oscillospiraceae bacterium]
MTTLATVIERTKSVCPECLKPIDARIVRVENEYFLRKFCEEHGEFSAVIWRGNSVDFENWWTYKSPKIDENLGLKSENNTCCALVEVTSRCNLRCPVCFAASGENSANEPSVEELFTVFKRLCDNGNTFIQLSGGEPTVRDDLPEIIAAARRAGAETVQLNSNGLRLGSEPGYAEILKNSGLSFVFMQFDGTRGEIYQKLRGRDLYSEKIAAIENCGAVKLGVTLVPTIVPGVNVDNIGEILNFALSRSPVIRGVHFQPISYFGRFPSPPGDSERVTLPEILTEIERQTDGKLQISNFVPSSCDHPRCGFHGDFVVLPQGKLMKLTAKYNSDACCCENSHIKNRKFVSKRWTRGKEAETAENDDFTNLEIFAKRVKSHGFTITGMAFQDAFTLDFARLRRCSLHASDIFGKIQPFCAKYLTKL